MLLIQLFGIEQKRQIYIRAVLNAILTMRLSAGNLSNC